MKRNITIEVTEDELNIMLNAVGSLPYFQVYELIHKLQQQAGPQLTAIYQNGKEILSHQSESKQA